MFCFDTRYDQGVSGFILYQDFPQITFLRPQASALVGTSATLRVGSPYVFSGKIYEFGNKNKKRYNFEIAKGRHLNFRI